MQIQCPSCQRPLEVAVPDSSRVLGNILHSLSSVVCPDCGLVSIDSSVGLTKSMPSGSEAYENSEIAHFTLIRVVGQGGYGEVWLARDNNLGREVALKVPVTQGPEMASLIYEAKTAASLKHPSIVAVHEVGTHEDRVFIASEYIDGMTLRDLLTSGRPGERPSVALMITIARALQFAHSHGVVHRDIKPANILIDKEGQPHVTDFGIAKRISADATISSDGQVIGTAKYMAPEQAAGKTRETDHRADVYALGVVLYEMLSGEVPFRGNVQAILHQKTTEDAPSPRMMAPRLSRDLETICLKCLERDPAKRYQSAGELADELERVAAGEPILARPISRLERAWRWCVNRPDIAGLAAGLFLTLTIGLIASSTLWRKAEGSRVLAEENWQTSERNREEAEANRIRAEENAESLRRSLYRARMNQAAIHHSNGDFATVRTLLDDLARDPFVRPLLGFEWHYFSGQAGMVRAVANHGNIVDDVAVSREGELCASIGQGPDKAINVWDASTGALVRSLTVDSGRFRSIEFSPVEGLLISGSSDGWLRLWNPRHSGRIVAEALHGPGIKRVRFSPDGKRVVSFGEQGGIRVWNAADLSATDQYPGGASIEDVRFTPDGRGIVTAVGNGQLRLWALGNRQPQPAREIHSNIQALCLSEDGQLAIGIDFQGGINICPLTGDGVTERVQTVWGRLDDVENVPQTNCIAVSSSDGRMHVYDIVNRREEQELETHHLGVGRIARSGNGRVIVTGSSDGSISLIRTRDLLVPTILWHDAPVREIAFYPDGERLLAADNDGRVRRWRLSDGSWEDINATGPARTVAIQPKGDLFAAGGPSPIVGLYSQESLAIAHQLTIPESGATEIRFSSTGKFLAILTTEGEVRVYRAGEWRRPLFERKRDQGDAVTADFAPADQYLAVAWSDGQVELLNPERGTAVKEISRLPGKPTALACCDEGRQLAIAMTDGQISLWDVASQNFRRHIRAHTGQIRAITPFPGEQMFATGGLDRDLKLWDVASGEMITSLPGHNRRIFTIAVAPDGNTVATGGLQGDIRLWRGEERRH